jgi:tyrosinase
MVCLRLRVSSSDECGYNGTLPYWDWTLDYEDPASSPVFDTNLGFGGNGDESSSCVIDGPFASMNVSTPDNHCLQRVFDLAMIPHYASPSQVNSTLETISYSLFRPALESGPHRGAHAGISGDMGHSYSPNGEHI